MITPELEEQILDAVAGGALDCKVRDLFGITTHYWYKHFGHGGTVEAQARIARAQQERARSLAEEMILIADDPNVDPQRAKNQIDVRKWFAGHEHSKQWGERVNMQVDVINVGGALAAARSEGLERVRSIRDQSNVSDTQLIDGVHVVVPQSTDSQSDDSEAAAIARLLE